MSENSTTRATIVSKCRSLDAKPIEMPMRAGTPDINLIGGWIECKRMDKWPKGANENPVRLSHPLSKEQGIWLNRRCRNGGTGIVALQVGREWLFFDGLDVKDYLGKVSRIELIRRSVLHFQQGFDAKEFIAWWKSYSKG